MVNLIGSTLKNSRNAKFDMKVEWIKGKLYNEDCLKPFPFDEDGVYEKELMVEALKRNQKIDPDYYILTPEKSKLDKEALLDQKKGPKGVLKIIYKEEGNDVREPPLRNWS